MTKKTPKPSDETSVDEIAETPDVSSDVAEAVEDAISETSVDVDQEIIEDTPEQEEPTPVSTSTVVETRQGGAGSMILGGVVAAGLGFGASAFMEPKSWPFGGTADDTISQALKQQSDVIQSLEDKIAELSSEVALRASKDDIAAAVAPAQTTLDGVAASVGDLETRLAALESLPAASGTGGDQTSLLAFEAEMQSLKSLVEDQKSALQAAADQAVATQQSAEDAVREEAARAALGRIQIAGDSGLPFEDALADFQANSDIEVAGILNEVSTSGVPALATIQTDFAANARAALAESRANSEQPTSTTGRLAAFFNAQTGARSVTPREGDDPDAVLSRVEAAVKSGNLTDAMAELEILPEVGRAAMSDWTAQVTTRQEALNAIDALSDALVSN